MGDRPQFPVPVVNHLGPNEMVAARYRNVAERVRDGYLVGGSNVCASVALALSDIASALESQE